MQVLVKSKMLGLYHIDTITLKPGNNLVDAAEWEKASQDSLVKLRIKQGIIEIEGSKKAPKVYEGIDGMKPAEAAKFVSELYDVAQLKQYKETETRKGVIKAIDDQLKRIDEAGKPRDGESENNATADDSEQSE